MLFLPVTQSEPAEVQHIVISWPHSHTIGNDGLLNCITLVNPH